MGFSELLPADVAAIQGLIQTFCEHQAVNGKERGYEVYHPSAFGGCLRQMQYQRFAQNNINGLELPQDDIEGRVKRIFDAGHSMHDRWALYWEKMGILRGVWECLNSECDYFYGKDNKIGELKPKECPKCGHKNFKYHEVNVVSKELNFFGHADLILDFSQLDISQFEKGNSVKRCFNPNHLPKDIVVADMKTANARRFKSSKDNGPDLKYEVQLKIYANLLNLPFGLLIYENKDNSDIALFKIDRGEDTDWPLIRRQAMALNKGFELKQLPPPRPIRKDDYECKYCSFKEICHESSIWQSDKLAENRKKFYGHLL